MFDPPSTYSFDNKLNAVRAVHHYQVNLWPDNALTYPAGIPPAGIPDWIDLNVAISPVANTNARLEMVSVEVDGVSAMEVEEHSVTNVSVTYEGLIPGVMPNQASLEIATRSELLLVDLNADGLDAEGRPRAIGSKGEGVNREVLMQTWHIPENIAASRYPEKKWKISQLTGSINEWHWRPLSWPYNYPEDFGWPEGYWLYLGAQFRPFGHTFFQVLHTFKAHPFGVSFLNTGDPIVDTVPQYRYFSWRNEKSVTEKVDLGDGEGDRDRVVKRYSDPVLSVVYPTAGTLDTITGRDLRGHFFADLEL